MDWPVTTDALGPSKVLLVRDPAIGLEAIVVVDNVAAGSAIGGVRMAPDVTVSEVARLARAMTLKNAAAGLAHGGAKAGIAHDPTVATAHKHRVVRAFARAIRDVVEYIPGPDMGLDEADMAVVHDEIGRAVGLPAVLGGIPLDELGATGFGLAVVAEVIEERGALTLDGARVAIQGFGAVGRHAARFLAERGAVVVAVADSRGAVHAPVGFDVAKLIEHKASGGTVVDSPEGTPISQDDLVGVDCDIWIPAARPDVVTADNVARLRAAVVLEGANIPLTDAAERALHERGTVVVPDFIANAGGVICAAVEHRGGTRAQAFEVIDEKIRTNTHAVLERSGAGDVTPRDAATDLARARVEEAMALRRR